MLKTLMSVLFLGSVVIYKIRHVLLYLSYWFHVFVWSKTPWWEAYARASWKKYTETSLYRDRFIEFGEEYAFSAYFGEGAAKGDGPHFKRKVREDKALMAKIVFAPYSIDAV